MILNLSGEVIFNMNLKILLILIVTDIVTGLIKAFKNKDLNSGFGLIGLLKHSVVIMVTLIFGVITYSYNAGEYYNLFIFFYFIQYAISIIENLDVMGIPVPNFLVKRLRDFKESEELEEWEK